MHDSNSYPVVYLLEYGKSWDMPEHLGLYSQIELALAHPIFKLPGLIEAKIGLPTWRRYWDNNDYYITLTTLKINENLPMYDGKMRELVGFPEFYERAI